MLNNACLTAFQELKLSLLSCLRTLCTILGASLHSLVNALSVESSSYDVVTHTREVLNTSASDEYDGVLLQFVSDTGDIRRDLVAVGDLDSGNLSHSRVRLFGSLSSYSGANSALLGRMLVDLLLVKSIHTLLERRRLGFLCGNLTTLANKLVKRRHYFSPLP